MVLFDVNVLIYSVNPQAADHRHYRDWIDHTTKGEAVFGVADIVLSAFLRIVTNPKAFANPSTPEEALKVVEEIRGRPNCVVVQPGPRHWDIFVDLCRQ